MPSFGEFQTIRELHRHGGGVVYAARRGEGGSADYVVKVCQPPAMIGDERAGRQFIKAFLERAETQKQLVERGAARWAPIHAAAAVSGGAYSVSDYYPQTVAKLVAGRARLDAAGLSALVDSVVEGLIELERLAQRGHGALDSPGNILLHAPKGGRAQAVLTDPAPEDRLGPDRGRTADLRALGRLICLLVTHQAPSETGTGRVGMSEHWQRLGGRAEGWVQLANDLMRGADGLDLEGVRGRLAELGEKPGIGLPRPAITIPAAAVVVIGLLAGVVGWWWGGGNGNNGPEPGPEQASLREQWNALARAYEDWMFGLQRELQQHPEVFGQDDYLSRQVVGVMETAAREDVELNPVRLHGGGLTAADLMDNPPSNKAEEVAASWGVYQRVRSALLPSSSGGSGWAVWEKLREARRIVREEARCDTLPPELDAVGELLEPGGSGDGGDDGQAGGDREAELIRDLFELDIPLGAGAGVEGAVGRLVEAGHRAEQFSDQWRELNSLVDTIEQSPDPIFGRFGAYVRQRLCDRAGEGLEPVAREAEHIRQTEAQALAGFVRPIDRELWQWVGRHLSGEGPAPAGRLSFADFDRRMKLIEGALPLEDDPRDEPKWRRTLDTITSNIQRVREQGSADATVVAQLEMHLGDARSLVERVTAKDALRRMQGELRNDAERVEEELKELDRRVVAQLRDFDEWLASTSEAGEVGQSEQISRFWRRQRDRMLAGAEDAADERKWGLMERVDTLRELLSRIDGLFPKASDLRIAGEGGWRDDFRSTVVALREEAIEEALSAASPLEYLDEKPEQAVERWRPRSENWGQRHQRLGELASAVDRLEGLLDAAYLPREEPAGSASGSVEALYDRWRDDPLLASASPVRGAVEGVWARTAALVDLQHSEDLEDLASRAVSAEFERPEVLRGAWRRLGELGWPQTLEALKRERTIEERLHRLAERLPERQSMLDQELAEEGPQRWSRCFARLQTPAEKREAVGMLSDFGVSELTRLEAPLGLEVLWVRMQRDVEQSYPEDAGRLSVRETGERHIAALTDGLAELGDRYEAELNELASADATGSEAQRWRQKLGTAIETVRVTAEVNRLMAELDAQVRGWDAGAPPDDAVALHTVEQHLAMLSENVGSGFLERPEAASWTQKLRDLVSGEEGGRPGAEGVGPASQTLPEALRWTKDDEGEDWMAFSWNRRRLVFRLVRPEGGEPVYLCTMEAPVRLFIEVVSAAEQWSAVREAMEQFDNASDPRKGPRTWTWGRGGDMSMLRAWLKAIPLARAEDLDSSGTNPLADSPMQYVPPSVAMFMARLMGCRLPTAAEWRAASGLSPDAAATANLRDAMWLRQREHIANLGVPRAPYPDEDIFLPPGVEPPAGARAELAVNGDDGWLWFAPVGPTGVTARFHHLVGNVAEYVFDRPDAFAEQFDEQFDAAASPPSPRDIERFLLDGEHLQALGVIGGSALSPREAPISEPSPLIGQSSRRIPNLGYSDVGFRLAFSAGSQPMAERLAELLAEQHYVRPSLAAE